MVDNNISSKNNQNDIDKIEIIKKKISFVLTQHYAIETPYYFHSNSNIIKLHIKSLKQQLQKCTNNLDNLN